MVEFFNKCFSTTIDDLREAFIRIAFARSRSRSRFFVFEHTIDVHRREHARIHTHTNTHTHTHRGQSETHTTIRIELTPKRKPIVSMGHVYDRSSTCLLSARHDLLLYTIYYLRIFIPRLPNGAIPAHTQAHLRPVSSKNIRDSRNPKVANEFFF